MSSRGTTLPIPLRAALSTGSLCIFDGTVGELQPHGVEDADKSDESLRWIVSVLASTFSCLALTTRRGVR